MPYFHVVFTVPTAVAAIAFHNKARVYAILFRAAAATLRTIAADPRHLGAEIGLVAVLHSWGQNLLHHPHVHCLVPGGGLSSDGPGSDRLPPGFFLPVRVLSRLFRGCFSNICKQTLSTCHSSARSPMADRSTFNRTLAELRRIDWVVFAKRPFAGPEQVLAYLGRYTHRVAIANSRLVTLAGDEVSFRWRDYRHHDKIKVMTLAADEFIRRFLLHTLPDGFHRIRHYGFLANGHRATKLALCRHLLEAPPSPPAAPAADYRERYRQLTGRSLDICPVCGGRLMPLGLLPRAWCNPPRAYREHLVTSMQLSSRDYGRNYLSLQHSSTALRVLAWPPLPGQRQSGGPGPSIAEPAVTVTAKSASLV